MTPEYAKRKEYFRQRYLVNRERLLAQTKAYQVAHPEVVHLAGRKYYAKNAEVLRQKRREAYAANPTKDYEAHRAWIERNRTARSEYMRLWREQQFGHRKAYDEAYRKAHMEERAERQNFRRARQTENGGSHTHEQWHALQETYDFRCGYCQASGVRLTKDHATPLARGGTDDISNIIPACLPCNRRKHVKMADEFIALLWASHIA